MARFTLFGGASDTSRRIAEADSVAVIGLGRFGTSLALELMAGGTEVLGIDADEEIVQSLNGVLTQVVRADSTKTEALQQLAVDEFDRVVVAIGSDITASILTCSVLLGMKVPGIWAKAVTEQHALILEQLGVHRVIRPEAEMGRRVAHLVRGAAQDYIEIDRGYAIVKSAPPARLHGIPLGQTGLRKEFGVTVAAFKKPGGEWHNADADTVLSEGDTILIVGPTRKAEGFAQLR
ncbi:trk system potassium uptake protein TrkA [Agromyces flavus]|uniref:Trk system potassium uptake protein TrkA n=1 Tax=Agromyces flavus TaxID=589382 RepID=A0A1H1YL04_9MICO|nr:TrkA family potassium uptake protein [Agromyces flavus]MCP2366727.1 trk system potassium uptake protein TrkA [Agromyces flavus]GGI45251.1 potassium transporter [Agromyces flavus]SDT22130.1 trk system potassium uptake protein TrkA [Agromyces flavus]